MKILTQYTKNGREWHVCRREGSIAIFTHDHRFYEVIVIQSHNGREIAGNHVSAAEYPPSNEQWGSKGWSFSNLADATAKYNELKQIDP
jgi:predicted RNA binding protein YcfA (HicA-like mRNA interferase family)